MTTLITLVTQLTQGVASVAQLTDHLLMTGGLFFSVIKEILTKAFHYYLLNKEKTKVSSATAFEEHFRLALNLQQCTNLGFRLHVPLGTEQKTQYLGSWSVWIPEAILKDKSLTR